MEQTSEVDTELTLLAGIWSGEYGYSDLCRLPDGRAVCINRLMFTYAILSGLRDYGYEDRWCFRDYVTAKGALRDWIEAGGVGEPEGWHRHPDTGRRRPDGDASKEYVEL